jgi:protein-S-isoprenylcysteine O-methyltransferase Ste14/membrane-associated phospholipid phosphatase
MNGDNNVKRCSYSAVFTIIGVLTAGMVICFLFVDEPVFSWLRHNASNFKNNIFEEAFEQLGKVFAVIWLLLLWVWLTGKHKTVLIGLLAMIITIPAVWAIKTTVNRTRPRNAIKSEQKIEKQKPPDGSSFPSGDTASVFAIGTVLAFSARRRWVIGIAAGCTAIGVLRVLDLAHYPSDVFAGAALGIFCGWAAIRIRNKNPRIENIFAGYEQMLAFVGIFSIPVLVWLFQGHVKLSILLAFYTPVAIIISLATWILNKRGETEQAYSEQMRKQGNWFFRWRSFLPLIIVPLFLIELRYFTYPENSHFLDRMWELFCLTISLAGLGVRIYTVGLAGQGTFVRTTSAPREKELNTTGIYSIVRHPLYLGNFVIWAGIVLFPHSITLAAFFLLAFFLLYERIIHAEEAFLVEKFGTAFTEWAQKTPMFVPRFKLWRKPELPFSWQTALAREYPAFFAIIASFTAIEIFGDRFYEGKWEFDPMWVIIFCTGLLVFVTFRTLKKLRIIMLPQTPNNRTDKSEAR